MESMGMLRDVGRAVAVALMVALSLSAVVASPARAYGQDIYVGHASWHQTQETRCNCVPAAARLWIRYFQPLGATPNQQALHAYMRPRDKNGSAYWDQEACPKSTTQPILNPYYSTPHDGRGWAWALYHYATNNQSKGFNDYRFPNAAGAVATNVDRGNANWEIVWNIRATQKPVGVIAKAGAHAVLVVGYSTDEDPWAPHVTTINGFRVWDPWYGRDDSHGMNNWPADGYEPDTYVTRSTWNSYIFKPDTKEGPYYMNRYVLVMQKSIATSPTDNPAISKGRDEYNSQGSLAMGGSPHQDGVSDESANTTIEAAFVAGLLVHGEALVDFELAGSQLGRKVHVESLVAEAPSYTLAEVRARGVTRAVALFEELDGGFRFGGVVRTSDQSRLPTQEELDSRIAGIGLGGSARAVWALTTDGDGSVFTPMLAGVDAASGKEAFFTSEGRRDVLKLAEGLTRR